MAAYTLFADDEVCVHKTGKGICFGLVVENSEFLSSSDEEGEKSEERVQVGKVKVAWHPSGKETVFPENKLQLVDRSLMPGDVVRRLIPGQKSQSGYIMDMDVYSHLRILRTNKYIYNVNSKDLQSIEKFEVGQEVMLDSWLGRVETVIIDAVLVFSDGAKCQIDQNELYSFDEKVEKHGKFSDYYYPGQELKGPLAGLAEAKWLHSTARHSHKAANKKGKTPSVQFTIDKIITKQVEVLWIFRGYEKIDNPDIVVSPPPRFLEGDEINKLQILDWFNHCSIQMGDCMFYRVKNDDIVSSVPPSKAYDAKAALLKDCPVRVEKEKENLSNADTTSATHNNQGAHEDEYEEDDNDDDGDYVDICEEEEDSEPDEKAGATGGRNTASKNKGSSKKKHSIHKGGAGGVNSQRHKHGQHAKQTGKKTSPKERSFKADDVVEVVVEFNTSWATVMWQDGTIEKDIPSVELFPVHHLDELEFFPGDYVLPNIELPEPVDYGVLVKCDHRERTCLVHWFRAYQVGKATEPTVVEKNAEISVFDLKDHPDYKFRPSQSVVRVGGFENLPNELGTGIQAVGQIFELDPNGHVVVKWTDGSITQCFPQEVFIVSEEADDSDNESWDTESDYDSEASGDTWETESESEIIGEDGAKGDAGDGNQLQGEAMSEQKQELNLLLGRAETALSRLQKLLNNFDVTVSAPECFTDIIRIYRSCHDLDKILQSSFFNDPELTALIAQAKQELSRGRVNRISQNLAQMFEQWSKSLPADSTSMSIREGSNIGTVSVAGKTIKIGTVKNGKIVEVNMQVSALEDNIIPEQNEPIKSKSAAIGTRSVNGGDNLQGASASSNPCSECSDVKSLKKESSESSISSYKSKERRPSDPLNDYSGAIAQRDNCANLVGENCVSKASKRTKTDGYDDSGREAKKSRDEGKNSNQVAQELCFKICQNLQKQVLKIQEEVNKRARRLISASGNSTDKSLECPSTMNSQNDEDKDTQSLSEKTSASKAVESQQLEDSQLTSNVGGSAENSSASNGFQSEDNVDNLEDSIPHSIDEAGERLSLARNAGETTTQVCDECGDVPKQSANTAGIDPGNEASCEESSSHTSQTSGDILVRRAPCKGFEIYGEAVSFHKYVSQENQPTKPSVFRNCIRKELKLFHSSLPDGIFVKGFEDRLDLYSVMILGPEGTPYEDALFLFDIMMPNDYPTSPPLLHYYSFCSDRLNPNLYEDGKVCVSLLGTWSGKGSEVWTSQSNLLQVLLSIQGLILVQEPYYNEAYYERQRGTQIGHENSRMYNEMAILKTVQSLTRICRCLPELFKTEIYNYLKSHGPRMIRRLRHWLDLNEQQRRLTEDEIKPVKDKGSNNGTVQSSMSQCKNVTATGEPTQQGTMPSPTANVDLLRNTQKKGTEEMLTQIDNDIEKEVYNDQPLGSSVDKNSKEKLHATPANNTESEFNGKTNPKEKSSWPSLPNGISASADTPRDMEMGTSVDKDSPHISLSPSNSMRPSAQPIKNPEFPLLPMSRGFCLTLQKHLTLYEKALQLLDDPVKATRPAASDFAQEKENIIPDSANEEEGSDIF